MVSEKRGGKAGRSHRKHIVQNKGFGYGGETTGTIGNAMVIVMLKNLLTMSAKASIIHLRKSLEMKNSADPG